MALKKTIFSPGFLFVAAIGCLSYGASVWFIDRILTINVKMFLALGMVFLVLCVLCANSASSRVPRFNQFKRGFLFILAVVLWMAFIVQINYFGIRYSKRWDLTRTKQHTLSVKTREVLADVHEDIRVTVFYAGIPPKYLEDMLSEYERLSNVRVVTEIVDPIVQIGYAAQFGEVINEKEHKVFLRSGSKKREFDFTEDKILSEERLTNAIIRVMQEKRYVYFLIGHNENDIYNKKDEGLSGFETMLSSNGIITHRLMLGTKAEIPEDCDVLVVAGARDHLSEEEEILIHDYLRKGGDALFLVEHTLVTTPDKPLTQEEKRLNPSLNNILRDWGLRVEDDIVVDLASHASGDPGSPATRNYLSNKEIVKGLDYTFYIRPRSIAVLSKRRDTIKLAPLVMTASDQKSWGETNRTLIVNYDEGVDRSGPVPIAFAVWEAKTKNEASDTRIVVFTDAGFLTNAYIGQYSNAKMGVNVINWLSERDYQQVVSEKKLKISRLDLMSRQKRIVGVVLFLIPICIAAMGGLMWFDKHYHC